MGMFDTVYAELDCPFCGRQSRHAPLTQEQAEKEVREYKQRQVESRQGFLRREKRFHLQDYWAKRDGFDDIDAWVEQLDTPDKIEVHRTQRSLGLAEIQTKQFENLMTMFYVGDEVPQYSGHYFIPEDFQCDGCSSAEEYVYVKVWLEIEERKLKAVLTRDPETGEPARESFKRAPFVARPPDPHPPLHFRHRNIQAQARWNTETEKYDMGVHHLPEHLHSVCRHLPSDFEPYGQRERDGADCSCGCKHFLKLPGKLGYDWGICANPASPRAGLLTFEHQGCEQFEGDDTE